MTLDPERTCEWGYTLEDMEAVLADRDLDPEDFWFWHRGQTGAICEGRVYNHETREYEKSGCGPHGRIVYAWDLQAYLASRHVHDHPA